VKFWINTPRVILKLGVLIPNFSQSRFYTNLS